MTARRNRRHTAKRNPSRRLHHQTLERRELLAGDIGVSDDGPRLISVSANSGENFRLDDNNVLSVAPNELTFRFRGGQQLDPDTFPAFRFLAAGGDGSFEEGNEREITPGHIGFQDREGTRIVVARFAETLADDQYLIDIAGYDDTNEGIVGLRNTDGDLFVPSDPLDPARPSEQIRFRLELGPQVAAVVPQPVTGSGASRVQHRDQIHVHFNDDPLSNPAAGVIRTGESTAPVVQPRFYNLFFTADTVENTDDVTHTPVSVEYDPALNRAVLTFDDDLSAFAPDGAGTFRLRVGSSQALPAAPSAVNDDAAGDVGDTFSSAHDLAVNFADQPDSILISGEIEPTTEYPSRWPGIDAPGTRDNRRDPQVTGQPDSTPGINRYYYNFAEIYGLDPTNNELSNAITDAQKQRTREILDLYADHLGLEFVETEDRGLQIVTGDIRAIVRTAQTGPGEPLQAFRLNDEDPTRGLLILDAGENWYDGYGLSPNPDQQPSWFVEALRGVGSLLGIGNTFDQVPGVASGSNPELYAPELFPLDDGSVPSDFSIEPDFLSTSDIIPGQALHRPETRDVDLYRFDVSEAGRVAIETFAQRLDESNLLDTEVRLWKWNASSEEYDLVSRNDDYYSDDSFLGVDVSPNADGSPARYVVGVTASGNQGYNADIDDSGLGGRSQGEYQMRVTFQNTNVDTIRDTRGTPLDGDGDGRAGGDFNFWFRVARPKGVAAVGESRTLFVDKTGSNVSASGTLASPYRTIAYAFAQSQPGDIVRILPSGGADGRVGTVGDNLAYELGRGGASNAVLADGENFNVPRGVTVMIDAGAIFKLRNAKISVGSEAVDEDRSLAALQVLGTPTLVDHNGDTVGGDVVFTSYQDESFAVDTNPLPTSPAAGQWAGIEFRNDFDRSEGRPVWETEGIFLDYVAHADLRYGGGSIGSNAPIVTPLQMLQARPTLLGNTIRFSSDAAISADPDSFEETNFHAPLYQRADAFTSDYDRVGPNIRGNTLLDNSINGLFVRVETPATGQREPMTVSGRFDDADIVHVLSEVLVLQGQPGGPLALEQRPDVLSVTVDPPTGTPPTGTLTQGETIDYRVTFVTAEGTESLASETTRSATVGAGRNLRLANLPEAPEMFVGRRLYRLDPATGDYVFVTQLDRNTTTYLDDGSTRGGLLTEAALADERLLPRFDARLSIDPGLILKLDSARFETGIGADFYAEGNDGNPIVFTSRLDDEFGAGGTFDTNNDGDAGAPAPGAWAGLVFRQGSSASLDQTVVRYAGGESSVSGGFANFNPVEILQSDVRIANSLFADNAGGENGGFDTRDGIGFNSDATIFVRGAQPIIVGNTIRDNLGAAISINPDALNHAEVRDWGRGTGVADRFDGARGNQGPLIAENRLDRNDLNGMLVRNEALTTESVWDDTDVVHVVERFVYAWNHHHRSGLRLKSDSGESLVVKFQDGGAIVADRYLNDVEDSIGGTVQVIGQPGFPVILTSLQDDTVGAGFTPAGLPQNDTDNADDSANAGDWYGIVLRAGANDRNVAYVLENEPAIPESAGLNAIPDDAQELGSLARDEQSSDENRRLGFNVRGTLSQNGDVDVYQFRANGQTEVYLDIDDTRFGLDTIVELVDRNGNIQALSNRSDLESNDPSLLVNNLSEGAVLPLRKTGQSVTEGPNPLDAGMRVILSGNSSSVNEYYVRVRSSNIGADYTGDPNDRLTDPDAVGQGLSRGQYQLSIRLREQDEIAGSTVRLADIRYATNAIDVPATPFDSPLAAEHAERLQLSGIDVDGSGSFTNAGAQNLGSLNESHRRVLRVSGVLGNNVANPDAIAAGQDIDVYRVDLFDNSQEPNIIGENRFVSAIFDLDYADQLGRANTRLSVFDSAGRLILHGLDSNVADDQGRPRFGNDMTNLDGGSAGTLDSYIGPVELQVGTYYIAVSSAQMTPEVLNQYFNANPADTNIRMLPVDSVRRLAEEGFSDSILGVNQYTPLNNRQQLNSTSELPNVVPLFDETSIVPYSLEDVRMFLTLDGGLTGSNQSTIVSIDPFTGQLERTIGEFGQPVGDLGMRRDGELFSFSLGPQTGGRNAGNTGNYLNISSIDGSSNNNGDDGLTFQRNNQAQTNTENDPNGEFLVNAMAFVPQGPNSGASVGNVPNISDGERLLVVGNRDNSGRGGEVIPEFRDNVVYSMVANGGAATNQGSTNGNFDRDFGAAQTTFIEPYGPASNKQELGIVDVGQFIDSDPEKTGGDITGIAQNQNVPGFFGSTLFGVTDEGGLYSFNPNDSRFLDVSDDVPGSYNRVINTGFHGTVQRHEDHFGTGGPDFSSLTLGPRATESGRYNSVFFATTTDGWLYSFQIDASGVVEPAPVLVHGRSAVPIITAFGGNGTGGRQITGAAFSIREENPWHQTGDRNTPFGVDGPNSQNNLHGVFQPHNQTRIRTAGGSSLYFGFEPTGNAADNTLNNDGATGNLAPGGVHGSTVSAPFSLEGYNNSDNPTLYFNYFLEVQDDSDYTLTRQQLDSFRVFATGDNGQWQLLSTNNSFRSFVNADEYDYFGNTEIPVQELHENTDVWRQARIDLSPLAGQKNVQLRFDFSSAGGMQSQFRTTGYLTEIQAVPGRAIVDGTTFSLSEQLVTSNQGFNTFEFVRGAAFNLPAGDAILDRQQISVEGPAGTTLLTLTTDPSGADPTEVGFARSDSAAEIASSVAAALQLLDADLEAFAVGPQVRLPEAESFALSPERFAAASVTIPDDVNTLVGQSLSFTNSIGVETSFTFRTAQELSFGNGGQTVTVTSDFTGAADGVQIRFINRESFGDNPAQATYNPFERVITLAYNSLAATPENADFDAVVAALDSLGQFSATLTSGDGTQPFVRPAGVVAFSEDDYFFNPAFDTADQIADELANRINNQDPRLPASADGTELVVLNAAAVDLDPAFGNPNSFNAGMPGAQLLPNGNVPVFYNPTMTDVEVRDAIRDALAVGIGVRDPITGMTEASQDNFPVYATNRIRVFEQALAGNNSAVGFGTFLPGDEFGSFGSTSVSNSGTTGRLNRHGALTNSVEGVYIDDITIGFASRGEVVLNSPAGNRDFTIDPTYREVRTQDSHQPERPNEILVGGYTLETRGGPEYGVPEDYDPIRLGLNEQFAWGRSFDVNDRFNPGAVTLNVPTARELTDGETLVISNGTRSVTFEFDSDGSVAPGHVRVPFVPVMTGANFDLLTDEPAVVARALRDAINSPQARNVLGITAAGGDSQEVSGMTGKRVELFGEEIQVNPSSGRFLKLDMVAEETPYGRETARTLPISDQDDASVVRDVSPNELARATVTEYVNGQADTLLAKGKIGDTVITGDANELIPTNPINDRDIVKVFLSAGDTIDVKVDSVDWNRGVPFRTPRAQIFSDGEIPVQLADSLDFDPFDFFDPNNPFGFVNPVPRDEIRIHSTIDGFVAPSDGYYYVAVSSAAAGVTGGDPTFLIGQYQLTIRPTGQVGSEPVTAEYHLEAGDTNVERAQGQLIIDSNFISDFSETGVRATYSGDQIPGRTTQSPLQFGPAGTALLRNQNTERLLPGTVISNNVITATLGNGIEYSGITPAGGDAPAPVPFGRIVNNSVVFPTVAQSDPSLNVEFLPIDDATIMAPNDDGSSAVQDFGFDFEFFGNTFTEFFVNNNGNLTFDGPLFQFTAAGFPQDRPVIAPFWADVDTRPRSDGSSSGTVHLTRGTSANRGNPVVQIDWVDVGYFASSNPANTGATNTFTVYIEDDPQGSIVAFRYGDMSWTTGSASGGTDGFGGTGAQIGFDSGDGNNFVSLGRPRNQAELDDTLADAPFVFRIDPETGVPGFETSDGTGILVHNSASPTVLNNVIHGFDVGLSVSADSSSTVENGNAFKNNTTASNRPLASQSIVIPADVALFENLERRLYIPAAGSQVIDSSFANLNDRAAFFNTVKAPVGISASPIFAPEVDAYGIPRVDDPKVTTPGGVGGNVFIDRGGIDRADFDQPSAVLVSPVDFIAGQGAPVAGGDSDPDASFVQLPSTSAAVPFFEIQLLDPAGTGPDVSTITEETVILTENGVTLTPGVDYTFGYSDNSRLIRLTPLAGLWRPDAVYEVTLNNKDRVILTLPRGDQIEDGDQYLVTDSDDRQSVFEFDSGYVMQVPQTLGIQVLGPNTFFQDGDAFRITSPAGTSQTFEINLSGAVASGNIEIDLADAGTVREIRDVILGVLEDHAAELDLRPRALGSNAVQIGSLAGHTIENAVDGLDYFGTDAGVEAGQQFRYQTDSQNVLFEFDVDGSGVSTGAVPVPIQRTDAVDEVAEAIAAAVEAEQLGLTSPRAIGDGRVLLGGAPDDVLTADASVLTLVGQPGVTGPLTLTVPNNATAAGLNGQTFAVDNGDVRVDFVFTTDPNLQTPNRRVVLAGGASPTQIATRIADEIRAGFTGELPATSAGRVVTLAEQPAVIPEGTEQILARIDTGSSPLTVDGVSGGAIPVPFIPSGQFAPSAAAAALTAAIASSPLDVTTVTPGGGTLLFGDTELIELRTADGSLSLIGQPLPAVSDLAGNAVESNRDNDETRFTIIMPEIEFDFGDAPDSYGTLRASNGARHTISSERTPRLGTYVDTESNGSPFPDSDDARLPIVGSESGGVFTFDTSVGGVLRIAADGAAPDGGETVTLNIGSQSTTFELVDASSNPSPGNVPVVLNDDDTPEIILQRLADEIRPQLDATGGGVLLSLDPDDPTEIVLEAIDDEDGISIGTFTVDGTPYRVFTEPGTDPDNVPPEAILGFLNPLDPSGTTVPITATGSGLVNAWIDFNQDGVFDEDEQILQNEVVVDGVNRIQVFAPENALDGDTWARFRISDSGNLNPTGVAVGGEVEDYLVSVLRVPAPTAVDDAYTTDEDTPLVVDSAPNRLVDNDLDLGDQILPPRVFVIDVPSNGTLTITDPFEGTFEYVPDPDFNGVDTFTYVLSSQASVGDGSDIGSVATVTIDVTAVNDPPEFDIVDQFDVLERDDEAPTVIADFITNALPGPATATDEIATQEVIFGIDYDQSDIPPGLFVQDPVVDDEGQLVFTQAADQFGTATLVITVADDDPNNPQVVETTVTLNVRPVNDAPRSESDLFGESDFADPDDGYVVADGDDGTVPPDQQPDLGRTEGTILYTTKEDDAPFFIPLRRPDGVIGFNRIGLLDVFNVGPDNESQDLPGGSQTLSVSAVPTTTARGGTLAEVFDNGTLIGYHYTPPTDFNRDIGIDFFTYEVIDDNPDDGETWSLQDGELVDDRRTATGTVELLINPVNDRPQFVLSTDQLTAAEDSASLVVENFATDIFAGPQLTALDEIDPVTGQSVEFTVSSLSFPEAESSQFFDVYPTITPEGTLTYKPAADVFGSFEFEVVLTDDGPDNSIRGDQVSSIPQLLTININPINDPPRLVDGEPPLEFTLLEDNSVVIPVRGDAAMRGLLDIFTVGPANEAADILPEPGGNQSIRLASPIPASTAGGGTLTPNVVAGQIVSLTYTPRANFNGIDSFIFSVIDDGVTVDLGGNVINDPRRSFATVTLDVTPVNDPPQFSGAGNVTSLEDAGLVEVSAWANNVQAGPPGAIDEINGTEQRPAQELTFVIEPVAQPGSVEYDRVVALFEELPTAVVDGNAATLRYRAAENQNGEASFRVRLLDDGGNANGGVDASGFRTFTIGVEAVNDPPQFIPGGVVTVDEDSGPYNDPWASEVKPGPENAVDEADQDVAFEVVTPSEYEDLFAVLPQIDEDGVLTFTPAENAAGEAFIDVTAIDSDGGTSETVTLEIVIVDVNDPPVAVGDEFDTDEDTAIVLPSTSILGNDIDPDLATNPSEFLTIVLDEAFTSQRGASVSFDPVTSEVTYDPTTSASLQALGPNESAIDTFVYRVVDSQGVLSNPATIEIEVDGVNDAPVTVEDVATLNQSGSTTLRVLDNDFDVDGSINQNSLRISRLPAFGAVSIGTGGTLVYTPFSQFSGEDEFSYTVADTLGLRSEEAVVRVSFNAPPVAANDGAMTVRDQSVEIDVAANDIDRDGTLNLNSIQIATAPTRGQAVPLGNGRVRYIPDPGFVGNDSFRYSIRDNEGQLSNVANVTVRVVASAGQNPVDAVDVNADSFVTAIDALLIVNKLSRDLDPGQSTIPIDPNDPTPPYYDVNGDNRISSLDALLVINALSRQSGSGEGEGTDGGESSGNSDSAPIAPPESSASVETAASFWDQDSVPPLDPTPRTKSTSDAWEDDAFELDADADELIDSVAYGREKSGDGDDTIAAIDQALALLD